ncbi:DUF805 domain-containing protein [Acetobacteraceae bacterium]|nr:DUF805 domain-containing protein [Acetobacteraceae bacterium]
MGVARRRLHDTNKSGWWLGVPFLLLLSQWLFVGISGAEGEYLGSRLIFALTGGFCLLFFVVLFVFFCIQSDIGKNDFGEMPSISISPMQRDFLLREERAKSTSMLDNVKMMQKLSELRDKGLLTEEEFQKKKSEWIQKL